MRRRRERIASPTEAGRADGSFASRALVIARGPPALAVSCGTASASVASAVVSFNDGSTASCAPIDVEAASRTAVAKP